MKKILSYILIISIVFSVASSSLNNTIIVAEELPIQIGIDENTPEYQIANYTQVAKTDDLTMFADEKGWFCIKNNKTNYIWYSHPNDSLEDKTTVGINKRNFQSELVVYYVYKDEGSETSSYTEASVNSYSLLQNGWIKSEKIKNGIKVTYDFYSISARICVAYTLQEDAFVAKVIGKETLERDAFKKAVKETLTEDQKSVMQDSYITSIWVLPTFGAGNSKDNGFVFVPDGCGAYMNYTPLTHSTEISNIPVYGEELSIDEYGVKSDEFTSVTNKAQAYIPIFAVSKLSDGFIATITKGDEISSINAYKSGTANAYTGASAQMDVRKVTKSTIGTRTVQGIANAFVSFPDFEIKYNFLSGETLGFADFAKYLRNKWSDSGIISKQEYNPSLSLKMVGAIDVDAHFLGFPVRKIKTLTTFEQANSIVSMLKKKSIGNIAINYVGWNNNGIQNSKVIKNANAIKDLGKKEELNDLTKNGDKLYLDADLITFKKSGNGVSKNNDAAKTAFDKPVLKRDFSYSTFIYEKTGLRLLAPSRINEVFSNYIKSFNKLSEDIGVSFNSISIDCYSDFGNDKFSRIQTVEEYSNVFSSTNRTMSADSANFYAFPYVERIFNAPNSSSRQRIYDGEIPFYQMLLHGYIAITSPYINQCSVKNSALLRAIETGSELAFMVMYEDSGAVNGTEYDDLYGSTFKMLEIDIVDMYKTYNELLNKISDKTITDYKIHSEYVTETVYDNEIRVFVNYGDNNYQGESVEINANSFTYLEEE